ncbi:hypothetical protein MKW92_029261 [Papaver armeniacum]|nr:hypothetical protein MKW92_029261 [Papaver armeniacum]
MAMRITTGMELLVPVYYYRFSFCSELSKEEVEPVARDRKISKSERVRNQHLRMDNHMMNIS